MNAAPYLVAQLTDLHIKAGGKLSYRRVDTAGALRTAIDTLLAAPQLPDIVIVTRARDAPHARHLYEIGVNDAVPETIEASLQLSEAALVGLGVPMGLVIASIHEQRDVYRKTLIADESQYPAPRPFKARRQKR